MSLIRFIIVLIVFYSNLKSIETVDENVVSVQTKSGLINGKIQTSVDGIKLNVFRGIPYAEPPVGKRRFGKPVQKGMWSQPFNAFEFQSVCPHDVTRFGAEEFMSNKNVSEDCLYLNIWSPINGGDNGILKPVMFWIHGGGLLLGSPNEEYYHGDALAAMADVVVVSVAYRLNIFGFLYAGRDDAPGNVGLWDQALALNWVSNNIDNFGGDPTQVTIFGNSAGSWSASLHIISPVSRKLFKNVIMSSGANIYKYSEDSPKDHIKRWLKGVKKVGCFDEKKPDEFSDKIMDCLRSIEFSKLIPIADDWDILPWTIRVFNLVVTDGEFLPKNPNQMVLSGDFKQDVNIMFTTVEDEGTFLISNYNDTEKYHSIHPKSLSYSEAYSNLRDMASGLNSEIPINGEDVAKLYFMGLSNNTGYDLLRRTIGIAVGDYHLSCPTVLFAKEIFRNSKYRTNIYEYYFNSKFEDKSYCTEWMGVCHFTDCYPMFGIPFKQPEHYSDKQREISNRMIGFLSEFVRTGKPSTQNGTVWPKYYRIDDNIIAPYYEISYDSENKSNFKTGYKITECEYLWKKYII